MTGPIDGRGLGVGGNVGAGVDGLVGLGLTVGAAAAPQPIISPASRAISSSGRVLVVMLVRRRAVDASSTDLDRLWHPATMVMRRFLGLSTDTSDPAAGSTSQAETATVRRIVSELGLLEPDRRRYLAGFAYILSRAAHADLSITDGETRLMEQIVIQIGKLPEAQAVLVVEIAKHQSELYGGTEDYLVTREFAGAATDEQRRAVVEACFAVVAADHQISATEYAELTQIADEMGLTRPELNVIRNEYKEHLTAIQQMRGLGPG